MKNALLFIALAIALMGCKTQGNSITQKAIENKAISLVFKNYPDCEKIVYIAVDTITYGANLEYRISSFSSNLERDMSSLEFYERMYKSYREASYKERYKEQLKRVEWDKETLRLLDSLKQASAQYLTIPTAYQVCVAYNYPTNFVWIQLDANGVLLKISKDLHQLFFNPGDDVPGYFKLMVSRFDEKP